MSYTDLEKFYSDDAYCGFNSDFNIERYSEYTTFVKQFIKSEVIEIGSGLGQAAYALSKAGINVIASDIYPENAINSFKKLKVDIPVQNLNCNDMTFENDSIDNYCLYQVLEHIETPDKMFLEIKRTLKVGGHFIIVGPNLISPLTALKALFLGLIGKWDTPLFKRKDKYSFPFGGTLIANFMFVFRNLALTFTKLILPFTRKPIFRKPCLEKPAVSDSDAAFMLNPLDTKAMLEKHGFEVISFQSMRKTGVFAGSTWIVAKKVS